MALVPLNLLITHQGRSSRQRITCRYKCGEACFHPAPNTSANEYFGDIAQEVSRRSALKTAGLAVLAVGAGSAWPRAQAVRHHRRHRHPPPRRCLQHRPA